MVTLDESRVLTFQPKAMIRHIIHGEVRVIIWRVRVRVMWVTIWYLTMNYLPMIPAYRLMLPRDTL